MSQQNTNQTAPAVVKKDLTTQVLNKIEAFKQSGELRIPANYSPENALKSAYLILAETKNKAGNLALDYCTPESIGNALLKMAVWGLSPLKKQCDFIMYGNKLECSIEYTGNIALAKRYGGMIDIKANAIFEGDTFEFHVDENTGKRKILKHTQTLESIGSKNIKGAYAVITMANGEKDVEIMSITQIKDAWNQGATKGDSPAHKNFPDQMSIKTVINRACKLLIRGSDDSILYSDPDENPIDISAEDVKHEVATKANRQAIDFDVEDAHVVEHEHQNHNEAQQPEPEIFNNNGPGF